MDRVRVLDQLAALVTADVLQQIEELVASGERLVDAVRSVTAWWSAQVAAAVAEGVVLVAEQVDRPPPT
jgi:hypothetical protein